MNPQRYCRIPVVKLPVLIGMGLLLTIPAIAGSGPAMICYSAQPNPYFNDHAAEIKKFYDGFFFSIGSWENTAQRFLGLEGRGPGNPAWLEGTKANLAALRRAGVTENFLTVYFSDSGDWPSAETLLSQTYARKMATEFSAIGQVAKELGFRGVCVDVEYPYLRYSIDHKIYSYTNYTVGDLLAAARRQGHDCTVAILDAFPDAPIILLPGSLRGRPIGEAFQLGMLQAMAERDATGGLHLGVEYTYCLHDPVTALATTRFEDPGIPYLTDTKTADYWRRRCTVAPGVWPTHMIETGGKDYPLQPWKQEIAELRQQMAILRAAAKRYVWSFSGLPSWYAHTPALEKEYGLTKQDLKRPDIDLRDWHQLLADKPELKSSPLQPVLDKIRRFDRGRISGEELCDAFGTPGRWWVLGLMGNPHTQPQFAAMEALEKPISPRTAYNGRDGAVRWFAHDNLDPRGVTSCIGVFDYRNTDNSAAHFVSIVQSPSERSAFLHVGWDDGIRVKLGDQVIFDGSDYPPRGKGMLYRDKHQFEKRVPFTLPKGKSQLSVTSLNSHGGWVFALRITGENDLPFQDVRFRLE